MNSRHRFVRCDHNISSWRTEVPIQSEIQEVVRNFPYSAISIFNRISIPEINYTGKVAGL